MPPKKAAAKKSNKEVEAKIVEKAVAASPDKSAGITMRRGRQKIEKVLEQDISPTKEVQTAPPKKRGRKGKVEDDESKNKKLIDEEPEALPRTRRKAKLGENQEAKEPELTKASPKKKRKANTEIVENEEKVVGAQDSTTIYDFTAKDINGEDVSLKKYKGHVCIIVNVASKCGHTKSNYEQFVDLYNQYKEKGLRILAFPCNQFGGQEPGDSAKICEFVKKRNVKFDMFEKISVNGKNAHPLWKFLKDQKEGPKGKDITWNFTKFVIDSNGKVVERHQPTVKPLKLLESLEKLW